MKKIIYTLIILYSVSSFSQEKKIYSLRNLKKELVNQIAILNDSIKTIELQINTIKSREVKITISDSSLTAYIREGTKLRKTPMYFGELITTLTIKQKVTVLGYSNDYFKICVNSICGYVNQVWVISNEKLQTFVKLKKAEEERLEKLEKERKEKLRKEKRIREEKLEKAKKEKLEKLEREKELKKRQKRVELEKKYKNKYGIKIYNKLKQGYYWLGMNKEMAIIALGKPNDINKSVGRWGVHEQWVYDNINLYFENGKLTSYQN